MSAIEISLPKDLEQAVCLKITIEPNDGRDAAALMSEVYFHGDKPIFRPGMKLWQQKLVVAQRTLLCRDLYGQVSTVIQYENYFSKVHNIRNFENHYMSGKFFWILGKQLVKVRG